MIRFRLPGITIAAIAALAACDGRDPVANGAYDTASLPAANDPAPSATGAPPDNATDARNSVAPAAASIPAAFHGRWGLSPGDCTSTRGDAKGLLVITGDQLRFYESRAVPSGNLEADSDSISGDFAFTGEGQKWTKFEALQLRGPELVRTENEPAASFTYAKCT